MALSTEYILTLLKTAKIGNVTTKLVNSNASYKITHLDELQDLISEVKKKNPRVIIPSIDDLKIGNSSAQRILEDSYNKSIKVIDINSINYPKRLFRLPDFPIICYLKGNLEAINWGNTVAVVGTREPTLYGLKGGRRIANIFGSNGFCIISGLAIGSDTAGHIGALQANALTVAVMAGGLDSIYPKDNKGLAETILDKEGALFSEYEPGFRPLKSSFVERDRLQSGLADGLIVIETGIKGGTMHSVGVAGNLKIPLGCLSNHPENLKNHDKTQGNKLLIERGAFPLGNTEQIHNFLKVLNPNVIIKNETVVSEIDPDSNVDKITNQNIAINNTSIDLKKESLNRELNEPIELEKHDDSKNFIQEIIIQSSNVINKVLHNQPGLSDSDEFKVQVEIHLTKLSTLLEALIEEQKQTNDRLKELIYLNNLNLKSPSNRKPKNPSSINSKDDSNQIPLI